MSDLAVYLARSGAFLALFYAFYWLALRRETFFALNRAYLLGAAALALVLPLLRVTSPFFETVVYATAPAPLAFEPGPAAAGPRALGLLQGLALVYAAGAASFLALFLVRLGRLVVLVRRCGCVRHHGLKVVLCGHPGESFSFFRFVFLNRSRVPEADLDRVLTHELAHVRQLHSLDIVFAELLAVIQWFNPFVWPYKGSLRETHEYLADRAVIAQGCGRARYQLLIVEQHVGGRLLELASSFRTSQIKRRIDMLSRQDTRGLARWKPLLALPLVLTLVLAFAESRTVVKAGPGGAAVQSGQEKIEKGGAPAKMTEEEMLKALQEKSLQLKQMMQKNEQLLAKLKEQLGATSDKAEQEKIQAEIKAQKAVSLEIEAKGCLLAVKKAEFALNKETDPAKRADLQKKMEELQAKAKDLVLKAETVRNAELGVEKKSAATDETGGGRGPGRRRSGPFSLPGLGQAFSGVFVSPTGAAVFGTFPPSGLTFLALPSSGPFFGFSLGAGSWPFRGAAVRAAIRFALSSVFLSFSAIVARRLFTALISAFSFLTIVSLSTLGAGIPFLARMASRSCSVFS